jgi:hypothetical protein
VHEAVDEQNYNESTQSDPPIGSFNARYRCFPVEPFHDLPPYTVAHKRGPARHVAAVASSIEGEPRRRLAHWGVPRGQVIDPRRQGSVQG